MFRPKLEEQEQVDPAEALMREVGVQLRKVRLERGEDLDHVAENLRIKPAYLEGIERGDLSIMPGRAYALGFLRTYAEYLGFDGDDLSRRIKSTVENLTDRTRLHIRTPLPETRVPKTSLVVFSLALVGGIYAGWSYLNAHRQLDVDTVAEVPDDLRSLTVGSLPAALPAPGSQPIETSDPGSRQGIDPAGLPDVDPGVEADVGDASVQAGVGDAAPSGDQAALPPVRQPRTAEAAAAEARAAEPSRVNPPEAGTGAVGTPVERAEPVTATSALDSIIEAGPERERARSAEVAGGGPSTTDAPIDRSDRSTDGETGLASTEEAQVVLEAGGDGQGGLDGDRAVDAGTAGGLLGVLGPTASDPTASGAEDTPQVYGRENADARVVIRARERSWIQIASADGDYVWSHTLEEGDVFFVPDRSDLTLWTGNAGGLQVTVDGRTVSPFGPEGLVQKDIPLDPDGLLAGANADR